MRRKSSAQNLLSSFKSSASSAPVNIASSSAASSSGVPYSPPNGNTPVSTTPLAREWDAQSMHSDGLGGAGSPALTQGTSVEYLRDLVQKRIITLTYIRNIHEGRSHWFHTILITRAELDKVFNNVDMKKRTYRFAILGLSLSNLLDINQPQDLLRGLLNTITEYDQAKEDGEKPKIRLFKAKNAKKGTSGIAEYTYTGSHVDSSEASYLFTPQIPFPLDYHQSLLSLLDVLSEVYNKISKLLGPSPFPHSSQHMMGTLGLLTPHPGVSYLFSGDSNTNTNHHSNPNLLLPPPVPESEMSGSLWGIANASVTAGAGAGHNGPFMHGSALASPPASGWTSGFGDMVLKIDGKLKKITSTLLKDLDAFARNGIKDELASLDPLLRNIKIPDDTGAGGGKIVYDFEGM